MADIPSLGMKPILTLDGAYTQMISQDANDLDQYVGIAKPGTATSSALWQIKKIGYSATGKVTSVTWAGGTDQFIQIWDNRASLSYS